MSARDDYPALAYTVRQAEQWQRQCDEIDRLRAEVAALRAFAVPRFDGMASSVHKSSDTIVVLPPPVVVPHTPTPRGPAA